MWKVFITKAFFIQFLNLDRDRQVYVLDSIKFLRDVLDLDSQPEYDIIDEYEDGKVATKRFPLTYHVDDDAEEIYLINIEESYRQSHSKGSV